MHEVINEEINNQAEDVLSNEESFATKSDDLEDGFPEENSLPIHDVLELHEQIKSLMCQNEGNVQ